MSPKQTILIENLLQQIHLYYPIGHLALAIDPNYKGKKLYDEILTQKINEIEESKQSSWTTLISFLKEKISPEIFDMGYTQFPSYTATFEIKNESNEQFDFRRKLIICISLLSDYYTVFFEDHYLFKNYTQNLIKSPNIQIVFSNLNKLDQYLAGIDTTVKDEIKNIFKNKEFVSHRILLQHKIKGGFTYTDGEQYPEKDYSIYNFLFDSFYLDSNLFITD